MRAQIGLRPADCLIGAAVLLLAILLLTAQLFRPAGEQVEITTPAGRSVYPLAQDATFSFAGQNGISVTVVIEGGTARFEQSGCPDLLCVHAGALSRAGQSAPCVPAGISLRITGEGQVDAVAY